MILASNYYNVQAAENSSWYNILLDKLVFVEIHRTYFYIENA